MKSVYETPVDFWNLLFKEDLVKMIATETNRYAVQKKRKHWDSDVTETELKAFLGCLYMMGIHKVPAFDDYFSNDWVLGVPGLQSIFTKNRWWQLWGNLHLVNNELKDTTAPNKLFKLPGFNLP